GGRPAAGRRSRVRALVTGGTGFAGSQLALRLLDEGHQVTILDVVPGLFDERIRAKGGDVRYGTVTDGSLLSELVRGQEVVFHLAAAFRKINLPKSVYREVNAAATGWLVDAARRAGVRRFVYCSTQGVHGHVDPSPGDETSPIRPEDFYQQTKYEGELAAREAAGGMELTIVRPTAIYGPGDPGRFFLLFRQVQKGWFPLFGAGRVHYHPVYVENLNDAFLLAAERPGAVGEAFVIGDERYVPIEELVRAVAAALGREVRLLRLPFWPVYGTAAALEVAFKPLPFDPPIFRRRVDWFRQNRAFDISKARERLGYRPRVGLAEGLRRTAEWYRAEGMLPANAGAETS
ncbi:MAG: NAD-dependent epimerase/dehydratase family protein, partial [Gemmatimonadota bacterium]